VCASAPCHGDPRDASLSRALGVEIDRIVAALEADSVRLQPGRIDDDANAAPVHPVSSSTPPGAFRASVERAKEYIRAGDAFQVVLSQRFERTTTTDPFDLYRMLRVVNPSPYQAYLQAEGCILVASSPEILCRVRGGIVTNRPLAGTRRRGRDEAEDARLEAELLADAKERAEIQLRRSRNLLWALSSRLKGLSDEATASPAIRARLLVDNALRLEGLNPRMLAERDDKNRHAQLIREYQSTFDYLRLNLGEDSMRTLTDTFHYPERIYALGEFVKLRREKAGLESRAMGIEKKIEEAREESVEAEKESACVEAFLRTRKAQKGSAIALGVALLGMVLINVSLVIAAVVGLLGLILVIWGLLSWLASGVAFAAFAEELKRKVSAFKEEGFLAVSQRLRKAQEAMRALEVRFEENRKELSVLTAKLGKAAELEPTWKPMTDLDVDNVTQKMTESCKQFFGETGVRVIFQNKKELALL
jgi:hypothetical protein